MDGDQQWRRPLSTTCKCYDVGVDSGFVLLVDLLYLSSYLHSTTNMKICVAYTELSYFCTESSFAQKMFTERSFCKFKILCRSVVGPNLRFFKLVRCFSQVHCTNLHFSCLHCKNNVNFLICIKCGKVHIHAWSYLSPTKFVFRKDKLLY